MLGLMSGTSLDGLDIVDCSYIFKNNEWKFSIHSSDSIPYSNALKTKLKQSPDFSARKLLQLDKELGLFFAKSVNQFIEDKSISKEKINAIASHGHTIFHQPELGYTYQIGCGDTIAYHTKLTVINDFRQKDVVAGGQGAPLVPIGDQLLFHNDADAFLNIGGFANCSYSHLGKTIAFDICPANLPLNRITQRIGLEFDKDGQLARKGNVDKDNLRELNNITFYKEKAPKSLGTEWLDATFSPLLSIFPSLEDQLATITEHIAVQIGNTLNEIEPPRTYVTGGGTKNKYLIERIKHNTSTELIIPSIELIDYKEAIIFGFLGALYLAKKKNTLASVTGAIKDSTGGVLHIP